MLSHRLEPALGVDGGLAALAGGGDRLSVAVVVDVAGDEHALDVRARLARAAETVRPRLARVAAAVGPRFARPGRPGSPQVPRVARPKTWQFTATAATAGLALAAGVVTAAGPWDSSGQRTAERDRAVALRCTHLGFASAPDVIAEVLLQLDREG